MEAHYSFEKGKHGGVCGMIFPYFRLLGGNIPGTDYQEYVPAGYLKCRGQILAADQYPNLANILGVGSTCIYKKEGTTLTEANEDGGGGTFQLPDLGSKYIAGGSSPGAYNDDTVTNPTTQATVQRAGIAVELLASQNEVLFNYNGSFRHAGVNSLSFSGQWRAISPPTRSTESEVTVSDFLAHGHEASLVIGRRINTRNDALLQMAYRGSRFGGGFCCSEQGTPCPSNGNAGVGFQNVFATEDGVESSHQHTMPSPVVSATPTGSIAPVLLDASSLETTVTMNTATTFKMDDIAPKFIICEYLIKY